MPITPSAAPHASPDRPSPGSLPAALGALLLDALLVVLFAALGQDQHATAAGLPRLLATASPFLKGLLLMSVLTAGHRTWSRLWPQGVAVWLGTVAVGMALRVLWGLGHAPMPFVVVALTVLGALLLGRRLLTRLMVARGLRR